MFRSVAFTNRAEIVKYQDFKLDDNLNSTYTIKYTDNNPQQHGGYKCYFQPLTLVGKRKYYFHADNCNRDSFKY